MKKNLLILFSLFLLSHYASAQCTELFFSEYIPATGNNKVLEVYNPTNAPISLSGYSIKRFRGSSAGAATIRDGSGGGWSERLLLSGTIPAYGTWVCVNGQTADVDLGGGNISPASDASLRSLSNQLGSGVYNETGGGDPFYFNGNDVLTLEKSDVIVDLFGRLGEAPLTAWSTIAPYTGGTGMGKWITNDYQLLRKATVKTGVTVSPSGFNVMAEWDTLPKNPRNVWTKLGKHECDCKPVGIGETNNANDVTVVLFPNPGTGSLNINTGKAIQQVKIYDVLGKELMNKEVRNNANNEVVDITAIPQGIYMVQLRFTDESTYSQRYVIQQ